jgi:hypothetical protein
MKKNSLKNVESTLSRKEMKAISGGYSKWYCFYHSTNVVVFGAYLHTSHTSYETCRGL